MMAPPIEGGVSATAGTLAGPAHRPLLSHTIVTRGALTRHSQRLQLRLSEPRAGGGSPPPPPTAASSCRYKPLSPPPAFLRRRCVCSHRVGGRAGRGAVSAPLPPPRRLPPDSLTARKWRPAIYVGSDVTDPIICMHQVSTVRPRPLSIVIFFLGLVISLYWECSDQTMRGFTKFWGPP